MIGYLKGRVQFKLKDRIVLLIDNIGYEVLVTSAALDALRIDEETELFTHEYIRDDARNLYGFIERDEYTLFHDLIKVSGVGPKMGLHVLALGADKIRDAVSNGDAGLIASISGVGKKTAQKIVLELKGVLEMGDESSQLSEEVVDALRRLGYSQREAVEALRSVQDVETTEEKIKTALKILGKR